MSIFEIGMLVCFGAAWPASLYKAIKSRNTGGKSALFSVIIIIGYICGILNKILNNYDFVLYLYIINTLMVTADLLLLLRNRKLEKAGHAGDMAPGA